MNQRKMNMEPRQSFDSNEKLSSLLNCLYVYEYNYQYITSRYLGYTIQISWMVNISFEISCKLFVIKKNIPNKKKYSPFECGNDV